MDRCVELPKLPNRQTPNQSIANDIHNSVNNIKHYLINATTVFGDAKEAGDGFALEHVSEKIGDPTKKDDCPNESDAATEFVVNKYSPVERENAEFHRSNSNCPK